MNAKELKEKLGLSYLELALKTGYTKREIKYYVSQDKEVPKHFVKHLELLVKNC